MAPLTRAELIEGIMRLNEIPRKEGVYVRFRLIKLSDRELLARYQELERKQPARPPEPAPQ